MLHNIQLPVYSECKICSTNSPIFDVVDFNKHCSKTPYSLGVSGVQVAYYRCTKCKFIFTNLIDKLKKDEISKLIYNDDYIKVDPEYLGKRAIAQAAEFIKIYKDYKDLHILDFGSGLGAFETELRSHGFKNVDSYDPFSSPNIPKSRYDLITSFECIEHDPTPLDTLHLLKSLLSEKGTILIGTAIQPSNIEEIGCRWWYIAPRNGHVSIFHSNTFFILSEVCGLRYSHFRFHFFSSGIPLVGNLHSNVFDPSYCRNIRLFAPHSNDDEWQEIEFGKLSSYRWTARNVVGWKDIHINKGFIRVKIPFCIEIQANFASNSQIKIGNEIVVTDVIDNEISCNFFVKNDGLYSIFLITPEPMSPCDFSESLDTRKLGIGILVS